MEDMINIINSDDTPAIFDYFVEIVRDLDYDDVVIYEDHGDEFQIRSFIIHMTENDISRDYHGYWESNKVGYSQRKQEFSPIDIVEFKRVIKQLKVNRILETFYTEV